MVPEQLITRVYNTIQRIRKCKVSMQNGKMNEMWLGDPTYGDTRTMPQNISNLADLWRTPHGVDANPKTELIMQNEYIAKH